MSGITIQDPRLFQAFKNQVVDVTFPLSLPDDFSQDQLNGGEVEINIDQQVYVLGASDGSGLFADHPFLARSGSGGF